MEEEEIPEYEICPHCGEPMMWEDDYDTMWCETLYWGEPHARGTNCD